MTKCKFHPYLDHYIEIIKSGKVPVSNRLKKGILLTEQILDSSDVLIDARTIERAVHLIEKYHKIKLNDWQLFIIALTFCYLKSTDSVLVREFLLVMGRGNGKNKFMSGLIWFLTTHYHGVQGYNVDIIANSEDQAKTSFMDIHQVLEDTEQKSHNFFEWNLQEIRNTRTDSYIKYNTSNAKTKDGKRSACLVFDELHEYENDQNIAVFSSGFGKRKYSRKYKITTKGYVVEGVLDDEIRKADDILNGAVPFYGTLPLIWEIDEKSEALIPEMWIKANPSINSPGFEELKKEMEASLIEMKYSSSVERDYYTKRMNWPIENRDETIATRSALVAASRDYNEPPEGATCFCGIDYASLSDFCSCGLMFAEGEDRIWKQHTWVNRESKDMPRIRAPLLKWQSAGDLSIVDGPEINPDWVYQYIEQAQKKWNVAAIGLDFFRYALLSKVLKELGYSRENENLILIRPSDIELVSPIIESKFLSGNILWGEVPLMRWATNNVKIKRNGARNMRFEKIEGKSRKTDPFMALVAAFVAERKNKQEANTGIIDLPTIYF